MKCTQAGLEPCPMCFYNSQNYEAQIRYCWIEAYQIAFDKVEPQELKNKIRKVAIHALKNYIPYLEATVRLNYPEHLVDLEKILILK